MPQALIYDRTSNSFWTAEDLNRIEEWSQIVRDFLISSGYDTPEYGYKFDWNENDYLDEPRVNRIRKNIIALHDSFFAVPEWRQITFAKQLDFSQANAMEWDLKQCYDWITRSLQFLIYSGEIYSGEM